MDAIHFHVREDNQTIKKAVYVAIGIKLNGNKEVLGMWIGGNESAKYWLGVLNEIKNRGVEDIMIVSVDGLTGFGEAIGAVFPKAEIQRCIVHQIRYTAKFVNYKDLKPFVKDLKAIYQALPIFFLDDSISTLRNVLSYQTVSGPYTPSPIHLKDISYLDILRHSLNQITIYQVLTRIVHHYDHVIVYNIQSMPIPITDPLVDIGHIVPYTSHNYPYKHMHLPCLSLHSHTSKMIFAHFFSSS